MVNSIKKILLPVKLAILLNVVKKTKLLEENYKNYY